ncbi:Serine/threonine-protein kinase dst2 OS=Dictyostelium discoideum GN=dst2 PE=3 SV=1 [Rhizoctonia solani AG-1 IB]|uniref:Serine/threonine-protein kinase dst2 n=1 Tax=Thanatephorus cucumeris (strain AG1-IB / isolate 7/3/14) TaxID=1108050 RepID=A0A0B7G4A6_THACB|nr:Serine/threonine-protein kinase dst2 OS=Dictyostelium discoideum GN=dst2 PE=3 SV=1 [Rhizoctonia solani AG-1 IB]
MSNIIRLGFNTRKDAKRVEQNERVDEPPAIFVPTAPQRLSDYTEPPTSTASDDIDIDEHSFAGTVDSIQKSLTASGPVVAIEAEPPAEISPASATSSKNTTHITPFPNAEGLERDVGEKIVAGTGSISREMSVSEVISLLVEHGCQDVTDTLQIPTFEEHPVSHGGFGDVFSGNLSDGSRVAVKALRISAESLVGSPAHLRQAARELHIWSKCSHPNVIPLFGLTVFRGRIGMVSPWMSNGSLSSYLATNRGANRHQLCMEICEGLSYLHEIGIVHGDLKGANVLVSGEGTPVLIDFGNSTLREQTLKFTQPRSNTGLTARWSALELLKGISTHTEASDVYALGMTVYEVIADMLPYEEIHPNNIWHFIVIEQRLPQRPKALPIGQKYGEEMWNLLVSCWSPDPNGRPQARKVTVKMRELALL